MTSPWQLSPLPCRCRLGRSMLGLVRLCLLRFCFRLCSFACAMRLALCRCSPTRVCRSCLGSALHLVLICPRCCSAAVALLLPAFGRRRSSANASACASPVLWRPCCAVCALQACCDLPAFGLWLLVLAVRAFFFVRSCVSPSFCRLCAAACALPPVLWHLCPAACALLLARCRLCSACAMSPVLCRLCSAAYAVPPVLCRL